MNLQDLQNRSSNQCEICAGTSNLQAYEPSHAPDNFRDVEVLICNKCLTQIEKQADLDAKHWQDSLPTAMWSEVPAVQVIAWRMLNRFRNESWAAEQLDMMYLENEFLNWAKASGDQDAEGQVDLHRDCNGAQLLTGDSVVLIKSLDVKGSTVNAALGTVIKNIRLDPNDTGYVEGKIEGQSIMVKTIFVRKQGAGQMS